MTDKPNGNANLDFSPADARELLDRMQESQELEDAEIAYINLRAIHESMGYPWRGEGEPDAEYQRKAARRDKMCQLHTDATTLTVAGKHEEAKPLRQQHQELRHAIIHQLAPQLAHQR